MREIPPDESAQRVIDQPQPPGYGVQILRSGFVQADGLGVLFHAAARDPFALRRAHHPFAGVQLREVLFEVLPERFRMESVFGRRFRDAYVSLAQPCDGRSVLLGLGAAVLLGRRDRHSLPVFGSPAFERLLAMPGTQVGV